MLSRRKLLLETLESRQLLAVDGLGLAGDSLTDEYINEPYGVYAQNWISLVGQYRSDELPLGEYRPTTISPPNSFDAPWGDLRRAGYEYNWALAGANSFTLLDPIPRPPQLPNPIGQHILLAQAIGAGDISHAVLAIGQNDFSPSSAAYVGIYNGSWDEATILDYSNQVLANIEEALTTINVGGVKLVMSNIIDYGVAPETQRRNPDPAGRARVSFHIEALNDRIEALAQEYRVPIVDSSRFAKDLLGSDSFTFGGVEILNDPGQAPNNAFVHDGIHPHTISSSIIANNFMNAVNVFYGENLTLFTEQEVLGIVGLNYVADTLAFDYSDYLTLPAQTTGLFFNKAAASEGYTLFSPNTTTTTYLIDRDGNTVNEWESNFAAGLLAYMQQDGSLIRASSPNGQGGNGTIVAAGSGGLIEQFDWQGNKVWEYGYGNQPGDEFLQHHDFEILPNGNLLLIAWELKSEAAATQAGRDPRLPGQGFLYPDHIVEVQPDFENGGGEIVWQWHVWDHLVQEYDATKDNWYGPTGVEDHPELIDINYVSTFDAGGGQAEDWTHANGIDYNPDRKEILLSVREFSEFWVIDHDTTTEQAAGDAGDLLYRWGNPQAYDRGDADDRVLFYQHDAKWVEDGLPGEGNITVFNNGFGRPGEDISSVEEIAPPLDTNGDYQLTAGQAYGPPTTIWTYQAPVENFSAIISGTERLSNGNTLITYGVSGTFVEVTPDGNEVWKYVNPHTGPGDLGPNDPIPNAGINGGGLDSLLTNFTFRAINQELDSIWSVVVSSSSIREEAAGTESVVYKLSGVVLENQQSSVQLKLLGHGDDLDDFFQAVADAVNQYDGQGDLEFDLVTRTLTYVGGGGGTLMDELVVPIRPVNDGQSEDTESVEFIVAEPSSATGALVKIDADHSLSTIDILDDDEIALNPVVVPSSDVNPANSEDSYLVASDGTITYTLREDNTQSGGVTEPFFIPLRAETTGVYNRIGLLDVFTVGPVNQSDGTPGGSQTLSLISPAADNGQQIIGVTVEQLTDNSITDANPQISGPNVVWWRGMNGDSSGREIMFFDGTTTTQVTDNDFFEMDPQVSGNNVTWWGQPGTSAEDREIFFWDGETITQVTNDLIRDELPQISGSTVVWVRGAGTDLEIYKWAGGSPQNVSNSVDTGDSSPQIDGNNIVYKSGSSPNIEIWRTDGVTNAPVSSGGFNKSNPQLDGDRVVWEQFDLIGRDWDIVYFDGTDTVLLTDNSINDFGPQISGQNIVWWGGNFPNNEIYLYDGFETKQITNNRLKDINPQIDGDIIVWQGSDGHDDEIFAWDGTGITQLTDNEFNDELPRISGNQVVWQAWSGGSGDGIEIFHADLTTGYMATELGGMLTPVFDGTDLIGWNYTPPADFNFDIGGVDSFIYEVSDDGTSYDPETDSFYFDPKTRTNRVEFVLNPVNDAPIFDLSTDPIVVAEDSPQVSLANFATNIAGGPIGTATDENDPAILPALTFDITPSDFDAADMPVFFSSAPELDAQTGRLSFQVAPNVFGSYLFEVRLNDGGDSDPSRGDVNTSPPQLLTINVQPVNDRPALNSLIVPSSDSNPANGEDSYLVAGDGTITYTLREDNTQSVGVTKPFFIPLLASTTAPYNRIGLLDVFTVGPNNESDSAPGGSQSLSLISPTVATMTQRGGTLTPVAGGWNYVPPTDFNFTIGGVDSFSYDVSDDGSSYDLESNTLFADPLRRTNRVELVLAAVNDAPFFNLSTDRVDVVEDGPQFSLANFANNMSGGPIGTASDENDFASLQGLTFSITPLDFDAADMSLFFSSAPLLDPQTGRLSFRTAADVFGSYRFEVRLNDGGANDPSRGDVNQSAPQFVMINVSARNDQPVIQPSSPAVEYTLNEDHTVEIEISDLLNVFDPGPLTLFGDETANVAPGGNQTVSLADPIPTTTSSGGTLQLLTTGGPPRLLYTPRANFNGTDSFVYTVTDDGATVGLDGIPFDDPRTATNAVTLNVASVNDAPVFGLTALVQSQEDAGLVLIENWATNVLAGPTTATDETSGSAAQGLSFVFTQVGGESNLIERGSLSASINPLTKLASLTYRSAPDANGTATFQVVLQDDGPSDSGNGDPNASQPQTLTIEVAAVNDLPSFTFLTTDPVSLAEDSGPQNIALIESISAGPANEGSQSVAIEVQTLAAEFATLFSAPPTIDSGGILHFTTAPNRNTDNLHGPVPVQILARDSAGAESALFSFQIVVSEVNDRPIANRDSFASDEDTVLTFSVAQLMANDFDPDLQTNAKEVVRIQLASQSQTPAGASLSYNEQTGKISYDPTSVASIQRLTTGDSLSDAFTYSLIDAAGEISDTVSVSLNIAGVNDAPILVPDLAFLESEGSTSIDVLANDREIDGSIDPTSVEIVGDPEFGIVVVTAAGVILYTPIVDIPAQHSFAYTVADNLGLRSKPLTVMISTNPAPTTGDDFAGPFQGESIFVNVVANDADADGLDLASLVIINGPGSGEAISQSDGTVLYVPDAEFIGGDSFTYRISDALGRPSRITTVTTQVVASRLQNPRNFADVNADGRVTAIDALLIINHLNRMGNVSEIPVLDSDRGPNYYDVSGNQVITALDALRVVNLLRGPKGQLEAEQLDPQLAFVAPTASDLSFVYHESESDWVASDLAGPNKIVGATDTERVSRDLIDTIVQNRTDDRDEDVVRAAIDALMARLI